jgi:hypothetical protein
MSELIRIFCNNCLNTTRHGNLRNYEEAKATGEVVDWQIVQCAGCETISFYRQQRSEGESGWEVTSESVYPPRLYRKPKDFADLPANLDQLYRETISAFNDSSLLFTAGGLRALVEGICADQGVEDGPKRDRNSGQYLTRDGHVLRGDNLECKIEGLAERRVLLDRQAAFLHEHRLLGNKALHALDVPDKQTLNTAANILEHIMEGLYNLQAQADELAAVRQGRP